MLNQYLYALLATGIVHLFLAFFVLLKGSGFRQRINQTYALYSLGISTWAIFEAFGITADDPSLALLLWRINHVGVIFIPVGFVHFVHCAVNTDSRKRKIIVISYIIALILVGLNCTKLLILEVVPKFSFKWFINPGVFYYLFLAVWIGWVLYGLFKLFRGYFKASGVKKKQLKYFCWSMLIAYCGGVPNFFPTFNIEIPILMPFGTYAIPLYAFATVYAIVKYRFMDIRVVLTRVVAFLIVYPFVLGIPLYLGYRYNLWVYSTWLSLLLATAGPFLYNYIRKQAEEVLLKEQRRCQQAIANLAKKISGILELDKLAEEEASTLVREVSANFCLMYLKADEYKAFRLKSAYPAQAKSRFPEFISYDSQLVTVLSVRQEPLSKEEAGRLDEKINLDAGSLVIPCIAKEGLLSTIILGSKTDNQIYGETDILAFKNLSYATSLAIENCIYWKELEERQRQARMAEMDLFSYSVAHEIDNPMAIIKGNGEYLRRHFFKEVSLSQEQQKEAEEVVSAILEAQTRVSGMVKAIEEFGKKVPPEMAVFKFNEVLEHYFNLYTPILKSHHIQLTKDVPSELPYVRGHLQELMQVLAIFSQNTIHALKYAPEKRIRLKVETINSDWIRVSFSDTGYGIAKEKLSAIFSAFVTTKASSEGTGMGLYNAERFILKHQGKIWAESEGKDKGSTLIFEIPVVKGVTEGEIRKAREDKGGRKF